MPRWLWDGMHASEAARGWRLACSLRRAPNYELHNRTERIGDRRAYRARNMNAAHDQCRPHRELPVAVRPTGYPQGGGLLGMLLGGGTCWLSCVMCTLAMRSACTDDREAAPAGSASTARRGRGGSICCPSTVWWISICFAFVRKASRVSRLPNLMNPTSVCRAGLHLSITAAH